MQMSVGYCFSDSSSRGWQLWLLLGHANRCQCIACSAFCVAVSEVAFWFCPSQFLRPSPLHHRRPTLPTPPASASIEQPRGRTDELNKFYPIRHGQTNWIKFIPFVCPAQVHASPPTVTDRRIIKNLSYSSGCRKSYFTVDTAAPLLLRRWRLIGDGDN